MRHLIKNLSLAACLASPAFAHAADCEKFYPVWGKQLGLERPFDAEHATCKVWPANPALTLAAMPYPRPGSTEDAGADDLLVLVADSRSGAVVAHKMQSSAIEYDGLRLSALAFDTARYQLTPATRAFGLRIEHATGPSSPFSETALDLYVIEGTTLRPVLRQLVVDQRNREWDGVCAGTTSKTTRTIGLGAAGAGGYTALQVDEQASDTVAVAHGAQCAEKDGPPRRANYTLTYRGGQYAMPKTLSYQQ